MNGDVRATARTEVVAMAKAESIPEWLRRRLDAKGSGARGARVLSRCEFPRGSRSLGSRAALWQAPTTRLGAAVARALGARPRVLHVLGGEVSLYELPVAAGSGFVALTLGRVILHRPDAFVGRSGRLILAHELGHVLQHELLGPLYLPGHVLGILLSLARSVLAGDSELSTHRYNPLEQTFAICFGHETCIRLIRDERASSVATEAYLAAFGV